MAIHLKTRGQLSRRPAIRLQAQGESLDPFRMNLLLTLDGWLVRLFEKTLGMLLKLQELRLSGSGAMSDPTGHPKADLEAMAALEFRPWETGATGWTPPTNAEWIGLANPHLISVRLAWLTLHKSKDELIAVAEELGDQGLMELVGQIGLSADWFEGLDKLLVSAETRIICAYAARVTRSDQRS